MARETTDAGGLNLAVLRLEGEQLAVDEIATRLSLTIESSWRKGEVHGGRPSRSSGLSAAVADATSGADLVRQLDAFLTKCKALDVSFVTVRAQLSVGISAGNSDHFVGYFELPPAHLATLAQLGLSLSVSAYPTADVRH